MVSPPYTATTRLRSVDEVELRQDVARLSGDRRVEVGGAQHQRAGTVLLREMLAIERYADDRIAVQCRAGDVVVVHHLAERAAGRETDADRHADDALVATRRRCL